MLTDADIVISKVEDGCHKIGYRYHLRIIMEDFLTVLRIHRVITPKANFGGIRPCNKTCFITPNLRLVRSGSVVPLQACLFLAQHFIMVGV